MERETKVIKLNTGKEIKLYTYITGREARDIQGIFLKKMKIGVDDGGQANVGNMDASAASEAQDKAIELLVIEYDGSNEKVVDRILDLPQEETNEILGLIDGVQNAIPAKKKES